MKVLVKFEEVEGREGMVNRPFGYIDGRFIGELFPAPWLKDGEEAEIYPVSMMHRGNTKLFSPICPCCGESYSKGTY